MRYVAQIIFPAPIEWVIADAQTPHVNIQKRHDPTPRNALNGSATAVFPRRLQNSTLFAAAQKGRCWQILLQKSFSTVIKFFSRPLMRFSDKYVRDLVS
jgi:hypothetical protein